MFRGTFRIVVFSAAVVLIVLASSMTFAAADDPGSLFNECQVWNTGAAKEQITGLTKDQLIWLSGWLDGYNDGASGTRTVDELVAFVNQFCATSPHDTLFSATRAFSGSSLPLTERIPTLPGSLRSLVDQLSPVNQCKFWNTGAAKKGTDLGKVVDSWLGGWLGGFGERTWTDNGRYLAKITPFLDQFCGTHTDYALSAAMRAFVLSVR